MQTPAALTPQTYLAARHTVEAHDHAVCVYDRHEDLVAPLARFVDEGVDRREFVIFVHSFPGDEEAWRFVEKARPDARKLRDDFVLVSLYRDAFEGRGQRIDYDHVMGVVGSLVDAARAKGRRGTRIFVDASRVYFRDGRQKEWFDFESWLGRRLQAEVGLVCAYQRADATRPDLFPDMLRTHAYRFDATSQ